MKWRAAVLVVLFSTSLAAPRAAPPFQLNSGKYGATFYWWYDHLPATTIYRPTVAWTAQDPQWWSSMVAQARDAGLGWLAPVCWGDGSNADPATLGPLVSAIDRVAPNLKVALFDDTTSEVLRKNLSKGRGWTLDERFDLNDLVGAGRRRAGVFLRSAVEAVLSDDSGAPALDHQRPAGGVHVARRRRLVFAHEFSAFDDRRAAGRDTA